MNDLDFSQVNTLVRIHEGRLIPSSVFQELLHAKSEADMKRAAENTQYGAYLAGKPILEDFMDAIERDIAETYQWALSESPMSEIVMMLGIRRTYHNLKVLSKAKILGIQADELWMEDGLYAIQTLSSAIETAQSAVLPDRMLRAISDVLSGAIQGHDVQIVDIVYDRHYWHHVRELAQRSGYQAIEAFVQKRIDLYNISVLIRAGQQKHGEAFLTSVLSSAGKISKADWIAKRSESPQELTQELLKTSYREEIEQAMDPDQKAVSAALLDVIGDDSLTKWLQQAKLAAFGPLPLVGFLYAKEMEWKNLHVILKAKRSGLDGRMAEERLRKSYVA